MAFSIAEVVTKRVVDSIKNDGRLPWVRQWANSGAGVPSNPLSKTMYRGINFLVLSMLNGHDSQFVTFNQVKKAGGNVRKGCSSNPVLYFNIIEKEAKEKDVVGKAEIIKFPVLKYYNVFNIVDVEGLNFAPVANREIEKNGFAETLAAKAGVTILHGSSAPTIRGTTGEVLMPFRESFESDEHYYSRLFVELSRASRSVLAEGKLKDLHFEELVAELAASMICAHMGIESFKTERTDSYIDQWIAAMNSDHNFIIKVSGTAQKVVDHLFDHSFKKEELEEMADAA